MNTHPKGKGGPGLDAGLVLTAARARVRTAKRRAREKGLRFELTPAFLVSMFPSDGCCLLCGQHLVLSGRMVSQTGVIDRIYPPAGYVPGNVRWLCNACNLRR